MPTMYEIYEKNSNEYDELISYEDYQKNLPKTLLHLFDFSGKTVLEFGAGTGRVTEMYASNANRVFCFDRSRHMLDKAQEKLSGFGEKVQFGICDNNLISSVGVKGDFVLEGWSFGHTVGDFSNKPNEKIDELISSSLALLNPGGTVIILETLGTDRDKPEAPSESLALFYSRLEDVYGFTRVEISTDYLFSSSTEAARIAGFFFGADAGESIREKGNSIVKEYTGLWYKTI